LFHYQPRQITAHDFCQSSYSEQGANLQECQHFLPYERFLRVAGNAIMDELPQKTAYGRFKPAATGPFRPKGDIRFPPKPSFKVSYAWQPTT
jgi:hypothetical protein